jgi:hypothetical protein
LNGKLNSIRQKGGRRRRWRSGTSENDTREMRRRCIEQGRGATGKDEEIQSNRKNNS